MDRGLILKEVLKLLDESMTPPNLFHLSEALDCDVYRLVAGKVRQVRYEDVLSQDVQEVERVVLGWWRDRMKMTPDAIAAAVRELLAAGFEGDIYRQVVANVLEIEATAVTPDQRAEVKRWAFGSFYGVVRKGGFPSETKAS